MSRFGWLAVGGAGLLVLTWMVPSGRGQAIEGPLIVVSWSAVGLMVWGITGLLVSKVRELAAKRSRRASPLPPGQVPLGRQGARARQSDTIVAAVIAATATIGAAVVPAVLDLSASGVNADTPTQDRPQRTPPGSGATGEPTPGPDDNETAAQTVWLVDLSLVDGGFGWETGSRMVTAETYEQSVIGSTCSSSDDPEIAYNTGAAYTRLRAVAGNTDDAPTDVKTRFEVEVDDQTAFSRDLVLGETAQVDVDVGGAIRLVLRVDSVGPTRCGLVAVWGDAKLTG